MKPEMSEFCQKDMGKGNFNFYVILMILLLSLVCIYFPISLVQVCQFSASIGDQLDNFEAW